MRIDKQNLPIFISIIISLTTFLVIWSDIGAISLPAMFTVFKILSALWGITILLSLYVPNLKKYVSFPSVVNAYLIYLGVYFLSFSRFKDAISSVPLDLNMVGIGLALVAIASGFIAQSQMQKNQDKKPSANPETSPIPNEEKKAIVDQELPSIDVVLDEVRRKQDFQFEQLDGLRTKSGIVMGIAGVIFTLLVTNLLGQSNKTINLTLARIALVPIFTSILLSFVPIYIRKWNRPPELERLRDYYIATDMEYTKLNVIDKCLEAIDENQKLVDKLFRIIKYSYFLLLIGLVLLAVWVGMTIW